MTNPVSASRALNLSKSRFMAGSQCHKQLWLKVHEKDAPELVVSEALRDLFFQGSLVGDLARKRFPDGKLVDLPHNDLGREALTRRLMSDGATAIFEATFVADRTYVAIDVLLREGDGWCLIEVKSGSEPKDKYILDAALQTHVARQAGVPVRRVEIMHLNKEYVHPGPNDLLQRSDVTAEVEALQDSIPAELAAQLALLQGDEPEVAIGQHCREPDECAFMSRCWPDQADGVLNIHGLFFDKRFALYQQGVPSIAALPKDFKLNFVQRRQRRAIETGTIIVEPTLKTDLAAFTGRLGFLDFETVARAIPRWDGTKPWMNVGVQYSYHEMLPDGSETHTEYLAPSDCDPRVEIAEKLVAITGPADRVLMYTAFEKTQLNLMKKWAPHLEAELDAIVAKMIDLKKLVHENVYHRDFAGSFSIKDVLPALVPGATYKDTVKIIDGKEASAKLARLLFYAYTLTPDERALIKAELLAYCKQDTHAMVLLLKRLRELAA